MRNKLLMSLTAIFFLVNTAYVQNTTINAAKTHQTIHGLGVNVNPQSWNVNPEAVKEVLDSLITGMGCTSFRLMFDDSDWEAINDNSNPNSYNWTYYDALYSALRFTCVWNTVEYLNSKGITDITLSPVGAAPVWMGGTKLTHYDVFKQLYTFVKPGFKRVDISTKLPDITMASFFNEADGNIVITGKNDSHTAQTLEGIIKSIPEITTLKYYFTDASHNFSKGQDVSVTNQSSSKTVPALCVFTLVGK